MRSSAARTDAVNARMSPPATSSASSGRIAVRIGWARMAYGARKNTNATWYATTPPATEPPTMIAAPRSSPVFALSSAPQPESRSNRPSPAWRPSQRGRKREAALAGREAEDPDEGDDTAGPRDREQQPFACR